MFKMVCVGERTDFTGTRLSWHETCTD